MPEQLKLYRIHPSEESLYRIGPATEGILIPRDPISSGHMPKYFAELRILHGSKEESVGTFVVKQYLPENPGYTPTDLAIYETIAKLDASNAEELRRAGVAVPSVVRYFVDSNGIPSHLISDLSAGGENTVWSTHDGLEKFNTLGLTTERLQTIEEQIARNVASANALRFVLTERAYLLVGSIEEAPSVIVGDFDDGVENVRSSFLDKNDIALRNRAEALHYLSYLKKIIQETTYSVLPAKAAHTG